MTDRRREKKSETLEVRVPWSLKRRLTARARDEGRTASEIVRDSIEAYLKRTAQRPAIQSLETVMTTVRTHPRPAFAAAAIAGAAGISALLTSAPPAGAAPELRTQFERMDADGDGVLTLAEMAPGNFAPFRAEEESGAPRGTPGGVVEFRAAPDAGLETIGPILLPATGVDGEERIIMLQIVRRPAEAGEGPGLTTPAPMSGEFRTGDRDGDGALSFAEFEERYIALRARSFAALDADGNGVIDEAEMTATPLGKPDGVSIADTLRGIDADGDGRITHSEYEDAV